MANELTKNLQVCFFLAYFATWGNGTKVQYSKPAEVAFPMVGKSLCVVKIALRGWKGKIFNVQPAVPNTLIALHRRHARQKRSQHRHQSSRFSLVKDRPGNENRGTIGLRSNIAFNA
jgi:hypothetical protein